MAFFWRRLIIVHAGSDKGFVDNACLIFKAGLATDDYHGQMNRKNFTRWLTEKFSNIPANSVVVLDNAPYHSVQQYKTPTKSSVNRDIIAWLIKKGISHDASARKFDLFDLVLRHKPPGDQKDYIVDRIIRSHGHTPLRTPPYLCELNPIELAWKFCQHVRTVEDKFWETDQIMEKIEPLVITIGNEDSSTNGSSSEDDSEDDSEYEAEGKENE
ncbi:uncharacterized protein LOC126739749 [Anthonomus grandis grandis]|uniref:uncharacterized protein LOC126739749 n=1 Tax=Anthonomus grandis grandis TaxID=2921223 RepID=UPI0021653D57|nr:uncharacterized protein LOC126739749 [Anthonomus grandis grandis]